MSQRGVREISKMLIQFVTTRYHRRPGCWACRNSYDSGRHTFSTEKGQSECLRHDRTRPGLSNDGLVENFFSLRRLENFMLTLSPLSRLNIRMMTNELPNQMVVGFFHFQTFRPLPWQASSVVSLWSWA